MNSSNFVNEDTMKPEETRTNLIINYLPQNFIDHELNNLFGKIGPLKSSRIMKDYSTGYSYGFGFVDYQKPEDAIKAIEQLNNLPVQHKTIKVSYARPSGEDIKGTNLYVQNIPKNYSEMDVDRIFASFGKIVQRSVPKDKISGMPRGVAFVRFDKKSEADEAISNMNGKIPDGGTDGLVVRVAEEHGKARGTRPIQEYSGPIPGMPYGRGNFNNLQGGKMGYGQRGQRRFNPMRGGFGNFHENHQPFQGDFNSKFSDNNAYTDDNYSSF